MNFEKSGVEIKFQLTCKINLTNSIASTDSRNGQNEVNVSERQIFQKYGEIQSDLVELTEKKNERWKLIISGPWTIATCTMKAIKDKFSENNND